MVYETCLVVIELLPSVQDLINRVTREHRLPPRTLQCYSVPASCTQTTNSCGILGLFGSILRYV